jgi:hypothetical protein
MPSGTRTSAPVSTGVAVSSPNSVAFRPSCSLIGTPMTPNIIQTAKQTVNETVLEASTAIVPFGKGACPGGEAGAMMDSLGAAPLRLRPMQRRMARVDRQETRIAGCADPGLVKLPAWGAVSAASFIPTKW